MKALFILILMSVSLNVQAHFDSPEQLSASQQAQLIEVLNKLDPEILGTIVTDETLEWYVQNFNRSEIQKAAHSLTPVHGRIELGDLNDPNAPKF